MAPLWPARPGPLVVLFSFEFARSPCAGAVLTLVARPSQYWRRLSEHRPGVLRAFYPLAVSQAFANPEDAQRHGGLQYCRNDPDVERCLRAHRNDMETIYPFLFLGFVYSFLGPNPFVARMHFLVFFLGRMVHTVAYLGKLRAPTRSLAYTLAQLPCASMALQIVWEAARHL
uniref:Prostaglandin E synthase n=1 Tax=Bos taurus TaxID=9913 RepID=A0AAA9SN12_BOVIN